MFSFLRRLWAALWRKRAAAPPPRPRTAARLGMESLDDRTVPAVVDVAMLSARLDTPTVVRFDYAAAGQAVNMLVGVYRSADPVFDEGDVLVGGNIITTPAGGGVRAASAGLFGELRTDLARKFVLVVADPFGSVAEANEANNTAGFRKFAVGAIAHGFSVTGNPLAWMTPFAAAMQAEGYDFVLPYVWLPVSQTPTPNGTVIAGRGLADWLRLAGNVLGPNNVVDVHLIGHSRGTAVVSQAFKSLEQNPGPRSLRVGYYRQTLLDPHVARNFGPLAAGLAELALNNGVSNVGQLSYDPTRPFSRAFAAATLQFQAAAQDPPAFVSRVVDEAEVFFQRLAWNETAEGSAEWLIGVNFLAPPGGVENPFGRPVAYTDLGPQRVGHYEVPDWYLANVVPTLGG